MPVAPNAIVDYLRSAAGRPLKAKELARGLGVDTADYAAFKELLRDLEDRGVLYRVQRQRYAAPQRINLVAGRFQGTRSGAGFVIPDEGGPDLFIPADAKESALDGDRVIARIERRRRGPRAEGSIIRVLERARSTVVGTYHPVRGFGFVHPQDPSLAIEVFIPPEPRVQAKAGDVVVARITDWGGGRRGPAGEIERVLGVLGDPGVDVLAVAYGHELPLEFPTAVDEEADRLLARGVPRDDLADRIDLRDQLIFTIDPEDAKDHDDALSIHAAADGGWEVGIHIADVGHYIPEGSLLDIEAYARGASVYLVDRVVPMLPHALSSDLCSLRPDVDRLALSLFITLDEDGSPRGHRLQRSVIRSRHRLSYEQAQASLDGTASIDDATDAALADLTRLARRLRDGRARRGSIDFDLPESRVVLGETGEPTDIQRVLRLESHQLIEDFMLLANETIAAAAVKRKLPFVYRIHEPPDEARLDQLREFAATFNHRLPDGGAASPRALQRLLEMTAGRPEHALFSRVVLRSMKQARYSERNIGHFGLAAGAYTHFTSPIRRYPDLVVHRLCTAALLDHERIPETETQRLGAIAANASERERVAVEAERDSVDLKKVEFMQQRIGETFDGTVSGVTAFGFYVLLDTYHVEGLVHVSSLEDDYYLFQEERYALIGERTRRTFQLAERVRVQVAATNLEQRQIDFGLVSGGRRGEQTAPRRRTARRRSSRP